MKVARDKAEQARIGIRNARRDANDQIKKAVEEHSLPEDSKYEAEENVQEVTNTHTKTVDDTLTQKEEEIMTV